MKFAPRLSESIDYDDLRAPFSALFQSFLFDSVSGPLFFTFLSEKVRLLAEFGRLFRGLHVPKSGPKSTPELHGYLKGPRMIKMC